MRRPDISGLCDVCGDVKAAHTLRQLRECRSKVKAPSPEAIRRYEESRRAPRPETQKLDIPPKIRQGRQRAIKAQERGEVVAPEDAEARRAYARLRWEQVPEATRKRSTKVSIEAKRRRRAVNENVSTKRMHIRSEDDKSRPLCGQLPRSTGKPVFAQTPGKATCKRCMALQDQKPYRRPSRPLKLHAPVTGHEGAAFCGMVGVQVATSDEVVTCRKCIEMQTPRPAPGNVRAWCHDQAVQILISKHRAEFNENFDALLILAGYSPETVGNQ